MLQTAKSPRC